MGSVYPFEEAKEALAHLQVRQIIFSLSLKGCMGNSIVKMKFGLRGGTVSSVQSFAVCSSTGKFDSPISVISSGCLKPQK